MVAFRERGRLASVWCVEAVGMALQACAALGPLLTPPARQPCPGRGGGGEGGAPQCLSVGAGPSGA